MLYCDSVRSWGQWAKRLRLCGVLAIVSALSLPHKGVYYENCKTPPLHPHIPRSCLASFARATHCANYFHNCVSSYISLRAWHYWLSKIRSPCWTASGNNENSERDVLPLFWGDKYSMGCTAWAFSAISAHAATSA